MRIAAGLLAWLSPRLTARLFGMSGDSGAAGYAWRLFGVRDVVLGVGTLRSSGAQRRAFAAAGLACDVADGAAGAISLYRNDFTRPMAGVTGRGACDRGRVRRVGATRQRSLARGHQPVRAGDHRA